MRNPLFSITIITISFCFYAIADYDNAPLWEDQTAYTHQSWDFGDSGEYGTPNGMITEYANLPLNVIADGEPNAINNYGTPTLDAFMNTHPFMNGWLYFDIYSNTNYVAMFGGMGDTSLSFTVPAMEANNDWIRQVWIQSRIQAKNDGIDVGSFDIDGKKISETVELLDENGTSFGLWYKVTALYEIQDCGNSDQITAWAYCLKEIPEGRLSASMIDRVDIDVRLVLKADLDRNGIVNYADFSNMAFHWSTNDDQTDLTNDGIINSDDLLYLSSMWLGTN